MFTAIGEPAGSHFVPWASRMVISKARSVV